ncbi:MAG: cyclic nucleotide-binding domain-containing protein, partial [Spirochaetaceae bacterium]|nr:cyclic nucleotide-binding domain-containing protein [Spirochaetaceae bacterium]
MKTGAPVLDSFIDDFRGFESLFTGPGFIQRNYKKDSFLNDEANYGKWQYYIVRGFVEAVYPDEEGANHMLFQKPKGSIVPLNYTEPACLTYSENIYLRAIEDTRVIEFSTELLRRLIHSRPDFALKCLEHKDKDANLSYYRVLTLLLPDSFKKVCRLLNDFYNG